MHVKNGVVLGLFVRNRPIDPAEDEFIFDTDTVYTTHGGMFVLDAGCIHDHYNDYVCVAPTTNKHE